MCKLPNMKSLKVVAFLIIAILALDLGTKHWAQHSLKYINSTVIIPNFFHLTYVENRGAAFGFLAEANEKFRTPFFIIVSIVAIAFIIIFYRKTEDSTWFHLGLLLILAGALGNLIDRVRLGFVIDFLDFHWYQYHWPAFNVADMVICLGVGILIFDMLFSSQKENKTNCTRYSLK